MLIGIYKVAYRVRFVFLFDVCEFGGMYIMARVYGGEGCNGWGPFF